jgi:hypothetical protein
MAMKSKQQILKQLQEEYQHWEALIARMNEAERIIALQPGELSLKDTLAHLLAWQQVSLARLEAAQQQSEPVMPPWLNGADPDAEEETDAFNARIQALYQAQDWAQVHQAWSKGFRRCLQLGEAISDADIFDTTRYTWLKGYALYDVLAGSYEHHAEHREAIARGM